MSSKHYFIEFLERLKSSDDKASLARLKRAAVNPSIDFDALAVVGKALPQNLSDRDFETYLLISSLYAIHPSNAEVTNLGTTLKRVRAQLQAGSETLDNRFAALLNARREDLDIKIRHLIRFISSYEVPVDYTKLLYDLLNWDRDDRRVQISWAKEYWTSEYVNHTSDTETEIENEQQK